MLILSDLDYLEFMPQDTIGLGGTAIAHVSSQAIAVGPNFAEIITEFYAAVLSRDGIRISESSSSSSAISN